MSEIKYGYMCKVDYDWELGEALGGNKVYSSLEDIKECRECTSTCGIVKVKIELEEVIEKESYGENNENN